MKGFLKDFYYLKRIIFYSKHVKRLIYISVFLSITLALLSPLRPFLVELSFDKYISSGDFNGLRFICVLMLLFLILEAIVQYFYTYIINVIGQEVVLKIREKLYSHVVSFRFSFFDKNPVGMLVTRVISDIETISEIFSQGLFAMISDLLKLIIIICVMLYSDWRLTLVSLSTIPVLLLATNWFRVAIKKSFTKVRDFISSQNVFVQERISGMKIVKLFNAERNEYFKFQQINKNLRDSHIQSILYYSLFFPIIEIISAISLSLILWWGGLSALQDSGVTLGEMMAFIMYINLLYRPIRQLADRYNTIQMGLVSSERVFKLYDKLSDDKNDIGLDNLILDGKIEFKNVSFSYIEEEQVLFDLSFVVNPGETLAIVGRTGSGKSTIANLLSRNYDTSEGKILLDNRSIYDYKKRFLKERICFVLQDDFIFSDTIINNIALGDSSIKREKIISAAKDIGIHDFIMRFKNGYDFLINERGTMLSTGERQLISYLRAYVRNPDILILDEATSSIDPETELLIQKATEKITKKITSVIIAHRISTIINADNILVLDKGINIEFGPHIELIKKNGEYTKLYDFQFLQ